MKRIIIKTNIIFNLLLIVVVFSCQPQDDLVKEQEQVTFTETITKTLTTVPYVSGKHPLVSDYFKAKRSSSNKSADNENYLELTFGVVDLNRGIGIVGESGSITFSFPVIVNEYDYQVFYNYIVKEDVSGDVSSLIRAYEMEASYATAYRNGEVDITSFTGQIKSYSTDGLLKNAGIPEENCPEDDVNDGTNDPNDNGGSNSGDDTTDDDNGDPVGGDGDTGTPGDPDNSGQPDPVCNLERYIRNCGSGSPGEENFHKTSECGPYNGNGTLSVNAEYMDAWVCFIPERNNNPEVCDEDVAVIEDLLNAYLDSLTEEEIEEWNWYEDTPFAQGINISELMDCFLNIDFISPNSTYSLTVYVEQPVPNSAVANNGTDPGHSFISMSINDPNISENNITQVFGVYPENSVNPLPGGSIISNGEFRDNSGHNYHVSATINLSNNSFYSIVNHISTLGNSIPQYNLNSYNCTDFILEIGNNQANMSLPDTQGTWGINVPGLGNVVLGGGSNPGNLGQDLRNLNSPNVTINTTNGTNAPNGNGGCN